jgi:hypothetical protein
LFIDLDNLTLNNVSLILGIDMNIDEHVVVNARESTVAFQGEFGDGIESGEEGRNHKEEI